MLSTITAVPLGVDIASSVNVWLASMSVSFANTSTVTLEFSTTTSVSNVATGMSFVPVTVIVNVVAVVAPELSVTVTGMNLHQMCKFHHYLMLILLACCLHLLL